VRLGRRVRHRCAPGQTRADLVGRAQPGSPTPQASGIALQQHQTVDHDSRCGGADRAWDSPPLPSDQLHCGPTAGPLRTHCPAAQLRSGKPYTSRPVGQTVDTRWTATRSRGITTRFLWMSCGQQKNLEIDGRDLLCGAGRRSKNSLTAKAEVFSGGNSRAGRGNPGTAERPGNRNFR